MVARIRSLSPKPAFGFSHEVLQVVIPDVYVHSGTCDEWVIELNTDTFPQILVNKNYMAKIEKNSSKDVHSYISEQQQSAGWLIRNIEQRSRTILRVATEIVRYQDSFFVSGIKGLNPLKLKIIADAVGMHESTVSRATANKYIATPRGIFEMKFFFTSGLSSLDDDTVYSSELIRQKIKQFVANEGENVLSDDKIGTILRGEGVDIARRTVAKYRTAMSIPSFFERRKKLSSHGRL
jgi:RNA polymerase sigma-54 factor